MEGGRECSAKRWETRDSVCVYDVYSMSASMSKYSYVAIAIVTRYGETLDDRFIFSLFIAIVFPSFNINFLWLPTPPSNAT